MLGARKLVYYISYKTQIKDKDRLLVTYGNLRKLTYVCVSKGIYAKLRMLFRSYVDKTRTFWQAHHALFLNVLTIQKILLLII